MKNVTTITAAALALLAGQAAAQVSHGHLDVVENDCANDSTSVTVNVGGGTNDWTVVDAESNRGDYTLDFGTGDDVNLGILITGNYEDARVDTNLCGGNDPYFATTSHARGTTNYWIAIHDSPSGSERNWNPSFGYFPIGDGWLTAAGYNSSNGDVLDLIVGNPSISLFNPFDDPGTGNALIDTDTGNFGVRLEGIDIRRDGVLLASGAKNEDNHVQVYHNADGTAVLNNHDNGDNGSGNEQDPVAFVFVPAGTEGVTMGVITGSGNKLFNQGDFTVEMVGQPDTDGTWRLEIAGEDPSTGTLVLTPTTEFGGNTVDNPVFVTPDSTGWTITSRDVTGMGLQDISSNDRAFHFAFFKNGVDIQPVAPDRSYLDRFDVAHSARIAVTEITPENGNGDMIAEREIGSDAITVSGENRADVALAFFGARHPAKIDNSLDASEGVYLCSSTEFIRDNSGTGGVSGWTTTSFDNGEMHGHNASLAGGELNSDFAVAFFPTDAGFDQNGDIQVFAGSSIEQDFEGTAGVDGVIIAVNWDNNNRAVSATPNGDTYTISCFEGSGGAPSEDWDYGYVSFPYSTPDLVAGQIDADGNVVSGTGNFTVSSSTDGTFGFPVTKIEIPGVDSATDGTLMLCSTDGAWSMAWEAHESDGSFEVAGFDLVNEDVDQTGFNFVYVPFEGLSAGDACVADFNMDGTVNTQDVLAFLNAWSAGDASADINDDGDVNTLDFIEFLNLWTAGC